MKPQQIDCNRHSALEGILSHTLDEASSEITENKPPVFSWQLEASGARQTRRPLARRRFVRGAAAVAAMAASAVVIAALQPGTARTSTALRGTGSGGQNAQSAPRLLLAAAHIKLRAGDAPVQPGQYRYIRTVSPAPTLVQPGPGEARQIPAPPGAYSLRELWIPATVSDLWMRRDSVQGENMAGYPTVYQAPCGDFFADTQGGSPSRTPGDACTHPGTFDSPTPVFIAGLPRDAGKLYDQLLGYARAHVNPDKNHDINAIIVQTVRSMLETGMITADLTSTLYAVLSRVPDVVVVPNTKNAAGVSGTGFKIDTVLGHGTDQLPLTITIIVDLKNGDYLGSREQQTGSDWLSAVSTGIADHLGAPGH
jgi:hypothetical protein